MQNASELLGLSKISQCHVKLISKQIQKPALKKITFKRPPVTKILEVKVLQLFKHYNLT